MDAETGCLLRLISYSGDTLVIWSELDDISTEPAGPDEFRVHVPPGTRIVEETGNLITDAAAVMPGVKGNRGPRRRRGRQPHGRRRLRRPELPGRPARPSLDRSTPGQASMRSLATQAAHAH